MRGKDFEAMAEVISETTQCADMIQRFCDYFKSEFPRFNEEKFKKACGWDPLWDIDMTPDWDAIDRYILGTGPNPAGIVRIISHR